MITLCGIFLFDKTGNILICRPYGTKTKYGWSIPKGKIDKDEENIDAAIRETYEETGINVKVYKRNIKYIGKCTYKHKKKRLHGFVLKIEEKIDIDKLECVCKIEGRKDPEIDKYEMVDPVDAIKRIHYTQAKLLEDFLDEKT